MIFTFYIPLVVVVCCLVLIGYIIFTKFPLLVNLNVDSLQTERETQKKRELMNRRILAEGAALQKRFAYIFVPFKKIWCQLQLRFRIYVGKIERLWHHEQRQKSLKKPERSETVHEKLLTLLKDADLAFSQNNLSRSEELYISAIKLDPKSASAYRGLADTYLAKGSIEEAKETYEFLLRLTPDDDAVMVKIAEIAEERGDIETAIAQYQLAVVVNDALSPRFYHLAELLLRIEQPQVAKEAILAAVDLEPKNPKYLDLLIETVILCGDKPVAKRAFEELRLVNPDNQKLPLFAEKIAQM